MNRGSELLICLCLLTPAVSLAATAEPEAPDLELLEFLGEWSGESEVWLQQAQNEEKKSATAIKAEERQNDE